MSQWMIYGANGYTGELVAREAASRQLTPVLAGRDDKAVRKLAEELGLEARIFSLSDPGTIEKQLQGFATVLHCAGPFLRTSEPMVRACIAARVHYLDITGEIPVFESILSRDAEARKAGVALVPGVGFDVVPTDCLSAILAERLPDASSLTLAFYSKGGSISRGTLRTMIESLPASGAIRRDGRIVGVPVAFDVREIPFSIGSRWAMTIPWGDVSTAFHTTGIPDIRVYSVTSRKTATRLRKYRQLLRLASAWPVRKTLLAYASLRSGPDQTIRDRSRVYLWGEVRNKSGEIVTATMDTPEAYWFTAMSAVTAARRVLLGDLEPGSWTPAGAFGARFAESIPGVILDPVVHVAASS